MSKVCVIFGAGDYPATSDTTVTATTCDNAAPLVIAADGGLDQARHYGYTPHLVVGDFDSVRHDVHDLPDSVEIHRLPAAKDHTDMHQAAVLGWQRGCRVFHIYGALGGRLDHSIANMQLIAHIARSGGAAFIHGDGVVLTALHNASLTFAANHLPAGSMVSVFSHDDASHGVSIEGLKYEVHDVDLYNDHALGVSNEFVDGLACSISAREGTLMVTYPQTAPTPHWQGTVRAADSLGPLDIAVSTLLNAAATH